MAISGSLGSLFNNLMLWKMFWDIYVNLSVCENTWFSVELPSLSLSEVADSPGRESYFWLAWPRSHSSLESVNPKFEATVVVAGILCSLPVPPSIDERCSKIQFLAMEHKSNSSKHHYAEKNLSDAVILSKRGLKSSNLSHVLYFLHKQQDLS